MLPKKLFNKAKAYVIKVANEYKNETEGKTGLAAVPIDLKSQFNLAVSRLAREEHVRINDHDIEEFLEDMAKEKIIVKHPWGGYMAPDNAVVPPKSEAKEMVLKELRKLV